MWGRYERRIWARLRAGGAGELLFLCLCLFGGTASAEFDSPKSEYFTGFEASDNYASGYVGAGYALGKAALYERGFHVLLQSLIIGRVHVRPFPCSAATTDSISVVLWSNWLRSSSSLSSIAQHPSHVATL